MNKYDELDEGLLDTLLGKGASGVRSLFKKGVNWKEQATQDKFTQEFVSTLVNSLRQAEKGGLLNTAIAPAPGQPTAATQGAGSAPPVQSPAATQGAGSAPPVQSPAAPQVAPAAPQAAPAAGQSTVPQIDVNYAKTINAVKNLTSSGSKEVPANIVQSTMGDIGNSRYNKDYAINSGNRILKLAQMGYNVSGLQQKWLANAQIGKKQRTVQEDDDSYDKLNTIFESIIENTGGMSVDAYVKNWFNNYMSGIKWQGYSQQVDQFIKNIADTYSKDKGYKAIQQFAKAAYSISRAQAGADQGQASAAQQAAPGAAPSQAGTPSQAAPVGGQQAGQKAAPSQAGTPSQAAPVGGQQAGQKAAPNAPKIDADYGKIINTIKNLKSTGNKQVPANLSQSTLKDIGNARYNKDYAINSGNRIAKLAQMGYNINDLQQKWLATTQMGKKQNTVQEEEIFEMAELFLAIGRYRTILSEGKLDEASAWDKVKSAGSFVVNKVSSANDAIKRVGQLVQNTAPVQGFDNKVEKILTDIGSKNPKIAATAKQYGEWAKKNPIKQGVVIGILTAVASALGGPGGGAAAGAILRAGNEMLKGEKASTALAKGAVGAGFGWLAGLGIRELGDFFANMHINLHPLKGIRDIIEVNLDYKRIQMGTGGGGSAVGHLITDIPSDMAGQVQGWWNEGIKLAREGQFGQAQTQFNQISTYFGGAEYQNWLKSITDNNEVLRGKYQVILDGANQMKEVAKGLSSAVQGAVTGAAGSGVGGKIAGAIKGAFSSKPKAPQAAPQAAAAQTQASTANKGAFSSKPKAPQAAPQAAAAQTQASTANSAPAAAPQAAPGSKFGYSKNTNDPNNPRYKAPKATPAPAEKPTQRMVRVPVKDPKTGKIIRYQMQPATNESKKVTKKPTKKIVKEAVFNPEFKNHTMDELKSMYSKMSKDLL
jgi:hypothetical protein